MIFVRDIGAMERFYRDVVGLVPVEETRQPEWVEFDGGWGRFSLHQRPPHILAELPPLSGEPRETGSTKLGFLVPRVSAEVARLRGLGVRVIERPWGGFDFTDPEGNVCGLEGPPGVAEVAPLVGAEPVTVTAQPEPEPLAETRPALKGFWRNRIPRLIILLLFGWLMAAIAGLLPQATFIFAARTIVAGPIMLAGLAVMLIGGLRNRVSASPATGGPFRNPLYLGMVIVLAGWAVFLCNPLTLLGLLGFMLVMNRRRS
jgi:catechol 2,3-dioxygenase-like lactoylglutathione lyase family enzyme